MLLLQPWFLLLGLAIPIAMIARRWRRPRSLAFAPAELARDAGTSARMRWLALPGWLQVLALIALVFALARPVVRERIARPTEGIDILLCLDLSSSMAATDLDPTRTRLEVAKAAAEAFIRGRQDDRIGLVGFARFPDLLCPLTRDQRALSQVLQGTRMAANDGPEDATGIGTAVGRAAQILAKSTARSRIVILLTDGAENVATAETPDEIGPRKAGILCKELGVRVYTIVAGIGSRAPSGEFQKLDSTQVRTLAETTGGHFFAAPDSASMAAVYARIHELEKVESPDFRDRYQEFFVPLLVFGMALFVLARFLLATVFAVAP